MAEPPRGYLIDTNVLSRKSSDEKAPEVRWLMENAALIRISAVTIAEMRRGLILKKRKLEATRDIRVRRRDEPILAAKMAWYETLRGRYADRIVAIDADVAEKWADVSVDFPSLRDGDKAILATALVHGFGVATRNLGDFRASGVALVDPFDPATWEEGADEQSSP
ncbi:PIN domain-containing protein [Methylobacterium sp. B4]|uniref:PIN domain-containing protein n=1 Tax=Methylobacterium sp. B4 TaxID=1938755 RepID=UPI000D76387F|nr:PIN domain-containing protein [Methylobacterium sp. B4]PXW61400.1 hypothetical protein BY998_108101 [Methylobacterium sp. B4]